jgi:hypothetical protein
MGDEAVDFQKCALRHMRAVLAFRIAELEKDGALSEESITWLECVGEDLIEDVCGLARCQSDEEEDKILSRWGI